MTDTTTCIALRERDLEFLGSSLDDLRKFPKSIRGVAGTELHRIQRGETPLHGRSMKTVGAGVFEIKIKDRQGAFRVFYVAKFDDVVYVLHAFQKKSQKTSKQDIATGQQRYKDMLELRNDERR